MRHLQLPSCKCNLIKRAWAMRPLQRRLSQSTLANRRPETKLPPKEKVQPPEYDTERIAPCNGCGEAHYRKYCPYYHTTCRNCHRVGHIERVCKAWVEKTPEGRTTAYGERRPGKAVFEVTESQGYANTLKQTAELLHKIFEKETQQTEDRAASRRDRVEQQRKIEGTKPVVRYDYPKDPGRNAPLPSSSSAADPSFTAKATPTKPTTPLP